MLPALVPFLRHRPWLTTRRRSPCLPAKETYTIDQIVLAARELREAAGADPERYTGAEVASLLGGEIEILRQRGFTDERITDLITAFDIDIKPRQIERRRQNPANLIRRLLWGRLNRARTQPGQLQTE
jgi:hypothetical protein